jgi:hypothetical protein
LLHSTIHDATGQFDPAAVKTTRAYDNADPACRREPFDRRGAVRTTFYLTPASLILSAISAFCSSPVSSLKSPAITPARLCEVKPIR